jgi:hypothetical protein
VALGGQQVGDLRSDEAGGAGDQYPHSARLGHWTGRVGRFAVDVSGP